MPLSLQLNGELRTFDELTDPASLAELIAALGLKADRVAAELNGTIVARPRWAEQAVSSTDKLEVVHFVGGGAAPRASAQASVRAPVRAQVQGTFKAVQAPAELQLARECDYPAVVQLANLAYRGAGAGWSTEAGLIAGDRLTEISLCQDLSAKPEALLLVLRSEENAGVQGTVWLEPHPDHTWYLGLLTVHPELQNQQLGRAILCAAERFAQARGASRMRMTVLSVRRSLLAWYQRRGFQPTGDVLPFPYGDERFGQALRDDLSFAVLEKRL